MGDHMISNEELARVYPFFNSSGYEQPNIDPKYYYIADDLASMPAPQDHINWQREYYDPISSLVIIAGDYPAAMKSKARVYADQHYYLLKAYLPQIRNGQANVNRIDGDFLSHSHNAFLIPYFYFTTNKDVKNLIVGYAKWLAEDHKTRRDFRYRGVGTFSARSNMRRMLDLAAFSQVKFMPNNIRHRLRSHLINEFAWLNSIEADGSINGIGWDEDKQVMYLDIDASEPNGERVVHVYFLHLWHEFMVSMANTEFYAENSELCEKFFDKIIATTKTVIRKTYRTYDGSGNLVAATMFNYRQNQFFLDNEYTIMGVNYNKTFIKDKRAGFPPYVFWGIIGTEEELSKVVQNVSVGWTEETANYSANPSAINAYTIVTGQRYVEPVTPNIPISTSECSKKDLLELLSLSKKINESNAEFLRIIEKHLKE
jgi:hypothetical protein